MSAAPAGEIRLRLVPVTEVPQPRRGLRWWLFKAREAAEAVRHHVLRAVVPRLATRAMRERAWLAGFTLALGGPGGWLPRGPGGRARHRQRARLGPAPLPQRPAARPLPLPTLTEVTK